MPFSPVSNPRHSSAVHALDEALHVLAGGTLGTEPDDIATVEAFWSSDGMDSLAAGFVVRLQDGQRAYLDVWIEPVGEDGSVPAKVDVELTVLPAGQRYPNFPSAADPIGGWCDDVAPLNAFLDRLSP